MGRWARVGRASAKAVNRQVGTVNWLRKKGMEKQSEAFYQLCRNTSAQDIGVQLTRQVSVRKETTKSWALNGAKLPLGVWGVKGYDTSVIAEKSAPEDISVCPKYGWFLYKVPVETEHEGEGRTMTDGLDLLRQARVRNLPRQQAAAPRTTEAKRGKKAPRTTEAASSAARASASE